MSLSAIVMLVGCRELWEPSYIYLDDELGLNASFILSNADKTTNDLSATYNVIGRTYQ